MTTATRHDHSSTKNDQHEKEPKVNHKSNLMVQVDRLKDAVSRNDLPNIKLAINELEKSITLL